MNCFETSNVNWQFQELIRTLNVFSLPAVEQREVGYFGFIGEEMVIDFYIYYTLNKYDLMESGFINANSEKKLNQMDSYIEMLSEEKEVEFWDELEIHEEWNALRSMAKSALIALGITVPFD